MALFGKLNQSPCFEILQKILFFPHFQNDKGNNFMKTISMVLKFCMWCYVYILMFFAYLMVIKSSTVYDFYYKKLLLKAHNSLNFSWIPLKFHMWHTQIQYNNFYFWSILNLSLCFEILHTILLLSVFQNVKGDNYIKPDPTVLKFRMWCNVHITIFFASLMAIKSSTV